MQLEEKIEFYKYICDEATRSLKGNGQKGNLRVSRRNNEYQYYLCEKTGDTNGKYIKKKERDIAMGIKKKPKAVTTLVIGYPAVKYHRTSHRKPLKLKKI